MKYLLFIVLMFGLPHSNWLPLKLNVIPENIPFGLVNWIMFAGLILWIVGKLSSSTLTNQIKIYNKFLLIVILSLFIAIFNAYEEFYVTLTLAKMQIMLLLLYYVPLSSIKDKDEFRNILLFFLIVHLIIGVEVLKSGVLAGSNYNDGKRGSGPFSEGLTGSDIAGSYLAQVLMFFCAFAFTKGSDARTRGAAALASVVLIFGIYATYARGALVACVVGVIAMLPFLGMKPKFIMLASSAVLLGVLLAPESLITRVDNTTTASGAYDDSTKGRFVYWDTALEIIKEQPLGIGIGQVRGAFLAKIGKHVDTHNGFLYTACEFGVIGLILFSIMIIRFYQHALAIWRAEDNPLVYRIYALGMGGMLGSFVTCNLFYANYYKNLVMGTIVLHFGLLAFIVSDITRRKGEETT